MTRTLHPLALLIPFSLVAQTAPAPQAPSPQTDAGTVNLTLQDAIQTALKNNLQVSIAEQTQTKESGREADPAVDDAATVVAVVMDFVGATLSQIEQLLKAMRLVVGGAGSPGSLFQWSRSTTDGVRITEVWQSRSAFELIQGKELEDGLIAARMPQPEITVYEVHSYVKEGPSIAAATAVQSGPDA